MIRIIGQKTDHLRGLFVQVTGFTCTTIDEIDEGVSPIRAGIQCVKPLRNEYGSSITHTGITSSILFDSLQVSSPR